MRTLTSACALAAACLLGGCHSMPYGKGGHHESPQPRPSATEMAAAQAGMATLGQLVNESNFARLGFNSAAEARSASLGAPLHIYRVQLDALQAMALDARPDSLLRDAQRALYPVTVGERVACAVFVGQAQDGYRASDFGNPAVARALTRYRRYAGDFAVQVPALQAWFLARNMDGQLMLTPVFEDNRVDWKPGQALPADQVFRKLQELARGYNGLPQ